MYPTLSVSRIQSIPERSFLLGKKFWKKRKLEIGWEILVRHERENEGENFYFWNSFDSMYNLRFFFRFIVAFVSFESNWHDFLVCQVFTEDSHSRNTYAHIFVSKNNIINRLIEKETRKRFRSSFHNDCSDSSTNFSRSFLYLESDRRWYLLLASLPKKREIGKWNLVWRKTPLRFRFPILRYSHDLLLLFQPVSTGRAR